MDQEPKHNEFEVLLEGKNPIKCISSSPSQLLASTPPPFIFTHGAGGTLSSDGILNFRTGFASKTSLTCFQGNTSLLSRVKMFDAVISHHAEPASVTALGGRSMGARAAIMAAEGKEDVKALVLVSYPLHTEKGDVRDEILYAIEESVKVLFVVGDRDEMCDLERLEGVRRKMKAGSWRVVVEGADHGMNVRPKAGTKDIGELTGKVAAEWLTSLEGGGVEGQGKEGRILWDEEENVARCSDWSEQASAPSVKPKKVQEELKAKVHVDFQENGGKSTTSKTVLPQRVKSKKKERNRTTSNSRQEGRGEHHRVDKAEETSTAMEVKRTRTGLRSDTQKEADPYKRQKF